MASIADIEVLIERADELPDGPTPVALVEEAVRIADVVGDVHWQFYARLCLVHHAFGSGDADKLLVALTWCLSAYDRNRDLPGIDRMLWQCKHALSYITAFPDISRAQIVQIRADIVQRYQQYGASLRPIWQFSCSNALAMGDFEDARACHERANRAHRDVLCESIAWERYFDIEFLLENDHIDEGLARAEPVLTERIPADGTYHWLALDTIPHLIRRGQLERAMLYRRRAFPTVKNNAKFTGHVGTHFATLAISGDHARAVAVFEEHLPWAISSRLLDQKLSYYRDAWLLMRLLRESGRAQVSLNAPEDFPGLVETGDTAELAAWFEAQTRALAARFDARNGNDRVTREALKRQELARFAVAPADE